MTSKPAHEFVDHDHLRKDGGYVLPRLTGSCAAARDGLGGTLARLRPEGVGNG